MKDGGAYCLGVSERWWPVFTGCRKESLKLGMAKAAAIVRLVGHYQYKINVHLILCTYIFSRQNYIDVHFSRCKYPPDPPTHTHVHIYIYIYISTGP